MTPQALPLDTPALSPSTAHTLISRSPLHAWQGHWALGGKRPEPTEQQERGQILEAMIFDDAVGKKKIEIVEAADWRGKEAKAQREEARANNRIPVLVGKYGEYSDVAREISQRIEEKGIKFSGLTQAKFEWESMGVKCKGRMDHWISYKDGGTIFDLKAVADASPHHASKSFIQYGYDVQAAAYLEAAQIKHPELEGRVDIYYIFAEVEAPFATQIYIPSGEMLALGQSKWDRAKRIWATCLLTGIWPSYSNDTLRVEPPNWAMSSELEINALEGK